MPTIQEKIHFNFDGVWSKDFNLINVVLDSSMYDEMLTANREVNETKIRGNRKPLFHSVDEDSIQFDMTIAFEKKFTDDEIDRIIRWLFTDFYGELYFEGNEDKIFMAMPVSEARLIHNGLQQGYFTLTMKCDSSSVYSPMITSTPITVTTSSVVTVQNNGHFDVYPEISIKKNGNGKIEIVSLDDNSNIFEINNITNGEDLYIDCRREIIETDAIGIYHYENQLGEFPKLLYGENRFRITGGCEIQFRYRCEYRF